jgi:alanine-glyoxylate transaminase/serine-glyoxylate transaminase/serine-pyruvate transaminase
MKMRRRDPLVMIPGPTPVDPSILKAMDVVTYGHTYGPFVEIYRETLAGLKEIFGTKGEVLAVGGSGTLAMEAAVVNILSRGDRLLVVSHGVFGNRFIDIAARYGIEVDVLTAEPGEVVAPAVIAEKLASGNYRALTVTHVDTSTGVCAPIREIGQLAREHDVLFIVDGVCATGAIEEPMDEWGIDIVVTTCQKAFGIPPGLTILGIGPKALDRRQEMGVISNYYCDWDLWLPIMRDPTKYFSTPPVNLILGLHQGVKMVLAEGLPQRFARHWLYGKAMRAGLAALGLEFLADQDCAAPTLSTVLYPQGISDDKFRATMLRNHILVAGGVGSLAGKLFRVGHMGNIAESELLVTLAAVELTLKELKYPLTLGAGIAAAEAVLRG